MTDETQIHLSVEELLSQATPPLAQPDGKRVARACEAVSRLAQDGAQADRLSVRFTGRHLLRPALRLAACLAIILGASLFFKATRRSTAPYASLPTYSPGAVTETLDALVDTKEVTEALATESANLVSDLATLTAVVNERTLAILF